MLNIDKEGRLTVKENSYEWVFLYTTSIVKVDKFYLL